MREGYCKHGKFVGGCGADLMCQWCEDDTDPPTIPVQLLRLTCDGQWEATFPPHWCYDYAHVGRIVDGFAELAGSGRLYALAIG